MDDDTQTGGTYEDPLHPVITSRTYIHTQPDCMGTTKISERAFEAICNPFRGVDRTFCAKCRKYVRLDAVAWEDSGENIFDYRMRVEKLPGLRKQATANGWGVLGFFGVIIVCMTLGTLLWPADKTPRYHSSKDHDHEPSTGFLVGESTGLVLGLGLLAYNDRKKKKIDFRRFR